MSIKELQAIEAELIAGLRKQAADGDPQAAGVLLKHLRGVGKDISKWQKGLDAQRKGFPRAAAADDGPNRSRHG